MPCDSLIEAIFAKDVEGRSKSALQICSLLVLVVESRRRWERYHLATCLVLTKTRLERCVGNLVITIGMAIGAILVVVCMWRCHCN